MEFINISPPSLFLLNAQIKSEEKNVNRTRTLVHKVVLKFFEGQNPDAEHCQKWQLDTELE